MTHRYYLTPLFDQLVKSLSTTLPTQLSYLPALTGGASLLSPGPTHPRHTPSYFNLPLSLSQTTLGATISSRVNHDFHSLVKSADYL